MLREVEIFGEGEVALVETTGKVEMEVVVVALVETIGKVKVDVEMLKGEEKVEALGELEVY